MLVQIDNGVYVNPNHIDTIQEDYNETGEYFITLASGQIIYAPFIGNKYRENIDRLLGKTKEIQHDTKTV